MRKVVLAALFGGLLMSGAVLALDPSLTAAAPTKLVVAGSIAGADAFAGVMSVHCQPGTLNLYRASPTANQDFRAFNCILNNAAPVPVAIRNTNVTVYYRAEGGSAWGPGSIAKSQPIKRLTVDLLCTVAAPPEYGDCAVSLYNQMTDVGSGHLVNALVDVGFSDQEPKLYRGENWVNDALGDEPAPNALESIARQTSFGQTFAVLANNSVPVSNLSRQDLASIFSGAYWDWSQIQDPATGNTLPAGAITVCRGRPGDGAQTAAATYFLNQSCGSSSEPFVAEPISPNGNPVFENWTASLQRNCISSKPGAIGVTLFTTPSPSGAKFVSISGVAPSKFAAARGLYDFWYEASSSKRPGLSGNANSLADFLTGRVRSAAHIPGTSASQFASPNTSNIPFLPIGLAGTPVAVGTKGGNSCKTAIGVF